MSAKPIRAPEVPAPCMTTNLDRIARKHATNFNQAYQASQGYSNQSGWIMTAIAVAVLCLTLKAMGAGQ